MGGLVLETVRDGVVFVPQAAASFRRAEAGWREKTGNGITVNSSTRSWALQQRMFENWNRYVNSGYNPMLYPGHSRALPPEQSVHCQGKAADIRNWADPGFVEHMAEHGWIRTADWDPTEQHHFEYQWWRDQHINEEAPAGMGEEPFPTKTKEWDEMATEEQVEAAAGRAAEAAIRKVVGETMKVVNDRGGAYSLIPLKQGAKPWPIHVVSQITGASMHVSNPYHLRLLQRLKMSTTGELMLPREIDVCRNYLTVINEDILQDADVSAAIAWVEAHKDDLEPEEDADA